jgi:hypothetical protein
MLAISLLALVSLGSAARGWTSIWQGFDQLTMGVDAVEVAEDRRSAEVVISFTNHSDEELRIHALEAGVRLSGRSVSAGSDRYDDLLLAPGDEVTVRVSMQITPMEREFLNQRLERNEGLTWNVTGRVSVSVEDLSDTLWLPYRANLDVQ